MLRAKTFSIHQTKWSRCGFDGWNLERKLGPRVNIVWVSQRWITLISLKRGFRLRGQMSKFVKSMLVQILTSPWIYGFSNDFAQMFALIILSFAQKNRCKAIKREVILKGKKAQVLKIMCVWALKLPMTLQMLTLMWRSVAAKIHMHNLAVVGRHRGHRSKFG